VAESYYLYFDGELSVVLFKVPTDAAVQPHDHGVWETLFVWRGALRHTVYERTDDRTTPGRAVLREHASTTLSPGDFAIVAPPRDIHGFRALTEGTYGITVSRGLYNPSGCTSTSRRRPARPVARARCADETPRGEHRPRLPRARRYAAGAERRDEGAVDADPRSQHRRGIAKRNGNSAPPAQPAKK
jgi:quercetin dioxygenase-like cupin family protein